MCIQLPGIYSSESLSASWSLSRLIIDNLYFLELNTLRVYTLTPLSVWDALTSTLCMPYGIHIYYYLEDIYYIDIYSNSIYSIIHVYLRYSQYWLFLDSLD